jgi:phenylpropionate dioxygenase-like ring-hydroxylating dioxygenase large terminal subunit
MKHVLRPHTLSKLCLELIENKSKLSCWIHETGS